MGKLSRTKGHGYERAIAIALRRKGLFPEARRHLEYQDGECFGVDLANTGHYRFQCKKRKTYAPITAIEEIKYDPETEVPILVTAADYKRDMVVMLFEDFLDLVVQAQA